MGKQDLMNEFYNIDNLVTVKIDLPEWEALKAQEPRGGTGYIGHRYDWFKATSVTISGTKMPKEPTTFKDVGVIKKSYYGSFDKNKPSMRLDFTRFDESNEKPVEKLIGTERLTLNNCKQDPGYLRQPLTYEIFRQAGVPHFRCNFVKVTVNDTDMGLYVNFEPFRKAYVKNNFDNDEGNAYELDYGEDLNAETLDSGHGSFEGFSKHKDKKDIMLAAELIKNEGLAGVKKAFDWEAFLKFWAMECLTKHRDGYTFHQNNCFAYNDVKAVANPTVENLNFKMVPSGVDMTLSKDPKFYMGNRSVVAKAAIADGEALKELNAVVNKYRQTVFSPENYEKNLEPFIQRLEAQMKAAGVEFTDTIKEEIKIVRSTLTTANQEVELEPYDQPPK